MKCIWSMNETCFGIGSMPAEPERPSMGKSREPSLLAGRSESVLAQQPLVAAAVDNGTVPIIGDKFNIQGIIDPVCAAGVGENEDLL